MTETTKTNPMTRLIICRHGNTFEENELPRRVGKRTDLPLVESGRKQAVAAGRYLRAQNLTPTIVYCSMLQRTMETAYLLKRESRAPMGPTPLDIFDEIDYGIDENQTEIKVISRLGKDAIEKWDQEAIVPEGWDVKPDVIIQNWKTFTNNIIQEFPGEMICVVTSNGIARFAPHITGEFEAFKAKNPLKVSTGGLCVLDYENGQWVIKDWNVKPALD